jgi:hypothetical protein
MKSAKVLIPVLSAAAILGSCSPYPEPGRDRPTVPGPGANRTISDADQQLIREQRLKAEEAARLAQANNPAGATPTTGASGGTGAGETTNPATTGALTGAAGGSSQAGGATTPGGTGTTAGGPRPTETKKPEYPYATKVPGKDGFVLSPYNNKVIDVRDIPTGTLVQDPNFPASEKKYFRIP